MLRTISQSARVALQSGRSFCEKMASIAFATYEEVKDLPNHPEKLLIDVRNVDEIAETGKIPTSINIPLPQLGDALKLSPETFKSQFSRDKPSDDQEVIFSCKLGGRAQKGAEAAVELGFKNVKNYKGSWTEWAEKEGLNK